MSSSVGKCSAESDAGSSRKVCWSSRVTTKEKQIVEDAEISDQSESQPEIPISQDNDANFEDSEEDVDSKEDEEEDVGLWGPDTVEDPDDPDEIYPDSKRRGKK